MPLEIEASRGCGGSDGDTQIVKPRNWEVPDTKEDVLKRINLKTFNAISDDVEPWIVNDDGLCTRCFRSKPSW